MRACLLPFTSAKGAGKLKCCQVVQLSQVNCELAALKTKNQDLTEKLAQLKSDQRDATKRHTLRFEILRDMLGLELLRNSDAATIENAMEAVKQNG